MVEALFTNNIIKSKEVRDTMVLVDRGNYIKHNAYMDAPQTLGYNITISAPHMHAHALELLRDHLRPGMRALDVGSGSGYLTACMALMVGERGVAVGIDHIPDLVELSRSNLQKVKYPCKCSSSSNDVICRMVKSLCCSLARSGWWLVMGGRESRSLDPIPPSMSGPQLLSSRRTLLTSSPPEAAWSSLWARMAGIRASTRLTRRRTGG